MPVYNMSGLRRVLNVFLIHSKYLKIPSIVSEDSKNAIKGPPSNFLKKLIILLIKGKRYSRGSAPKGAICEKRC